jgi:hypothetical protein
VQCSRDESWSLDVIEGHGAVGACGGIYRLP